MRSLGAFGACLLAAGMLLSGGCGSVCGALGDQGSGRCQELTIEGSGRYAALGVTLRYDAPVAWGQRATSRVLAGELELPATVPVLLPEGVPATSVRSLAVSAHSATGEEVAGGSLALALAESGPLAATLPGLSRFQREDSPRFQFRDPPPEYWLDGGYASGLAVGDVNGI